MSAIQILFIGNSFTNRNDLPETITLLAAAGKPSRRIETRRVIFNGMSLRAHWNRGEARKAIAESAWDYVALQEQSTLPLKNRERMHESITLFDEEIKGRGARTVLYQTWARQHEFERQDELSDAYASIGRTLGAIVVPVGDAWKMMISKHPELLLHDKDKSHPNAAGSYLAACVFFATLFKSSPVGLPALAPIEPRIARLLQNAARRTCQTTLAGS